MHKNLTLMEFSQDAVWDPVDTQDVAVLSDHLKLFCWIAPVPDDLTLLNADATNKSHRSPRGTSAHRHQCERKMENEQQSLIVNHIASIFCNFNTTHFYKANGFKF